MLLLELSFSARVELILGEELFRGDLTFDGLLVDSG